MQLTHQSLGLFIYLFFILLLPCCYIVSHVIFVYDCCFLLGVRLECDGGRDSQTSRAWSPGCWSTTMGEETRCADWKHLSSNLVSSLPPGSALSHQNRVIELGVGKGHGQLTPCRVHALPGVDVSFAAFYQMNFY